jgi:hypothetical protein
MNLDFPHSQELAETWKDLESKGYRVSKVDPRDLFIESPLPILGITLGAYTRTGYEYSDIASGSTVEEAFWRLFDNLVAERLETIR